MDALESLCFMVNSPVRLRVLRFVSEPATLNELVEGLPHSRPAIRKAAEWYVDHGWFSKQAGHYHRTAIGASVLQHFDGTHKADAGSISREDMQFICDSDTRLALLCYSSLPVTASGLTDYWDGDSTAAKRMMETLAARGWYKRQGQTYQRTRTGDAAHAEFERLLAVLEQIADKKPLFNRLPNHLADLPISGLENATLFTPAGGPDAALWALKRLCDDATNGGSLDCIRTVCPVYRSTSISTMREFVSFSTTTEIVFDQPTFRTLCAPEQWPVLGAMITHPYTEVRVYPDDLSFGVGAYDEQGMISVYNDHPGNAAGVASTDEQLLEWINATVDDYWQHSEPVSEELTTRIGKYADTSFWDVSDTMMWGASDEDETASAMLYDLITS